MSTRQGGLACAFGGRVRGQSVQSGVLGVSDAVLAACALAVVCLDRGDAGAGVVGRQAGDPVPVCVGEGELRAGVGSFLAGDDAHTVWPGPQVEQPVMSATHAPSRGVPSPSAAGIHDSAGTSSMAALRWGRYPANPTE
jgi:hypothetical protein